MAGQPPLPELELPWFYAERPADLYYNVVIGLEGVGYVSVSFNLRRFTLGYSAIGYISASCKPEVPYEGRGWRDRLLQDAMNALSAVKDS